MANPGQGYKGKLQFGREAAYKTAVAATHAFGYLDAGVTLNNGLAEDNTILGVRLMDPPFLTVASVSWFAEFYLDYDTQALLIDTGRGTGTYGSNGGTTSGAGPFTHTWTEKDFFNSLTLEFIQGDVPSGKCVRVDGAKVTSWTIRGSSGQGDANAMRLRVEGIGAAYTLNQTPTAALTISARNVVLFRHLTTVNTGLSESAGDIKITSLEISESNPLTTEATGGSGATIDEPLVNGLPETSVKWTQRFHTNAAQTAYQGNTAVNPVFTFTSGTKSLTFTVQNGRISSPVDPSLGGFGLLTQDVAVKCYRNTTSALQVQLVNSKATITTP